MLMIIEVWIMPIIFIFAPEVSHWDARVGWMFLFFFFFRKTPGELDRPLRIGLFPTPSSHGFLWLINGG